MGMGTGIDLEELGEPMAYSLFGDCCLRMAQSAYEMEKTLRGDSPIRMTELECQAALIGSVSEALAWIRELGIPEDVEVGANALKRFA